VSVAQALQDGPCFHCGGSLDTRDAVFSPIDGETHGFCCHGCLGAAELIHELGLFSYYGRREPPGPTSLPLDTESGRAFERFDDPALQRGFVAVDDDGERSATLSIGGMRCAACSWLVEERLARVAGVRDAQVGLASQRARVRWDPEAIRLSEILGCIAELGYRAEPFEPDSEEALLREDRRATLRRLGVSGLGTMQVMMFSVALYAGGFGDQDDAHRDLLRVAGLLVTTPVLFYAGWPFLVGAWRDLRCVRVGPDVPISLALLGAYLASGWATAHGVGEVYFDSVCMFIFFITGGRAIERDLRTRAELRVRGLQRRVPQVAHRLEEGVETDVPATSVRPGDVLVVRPGECVPADGIVIEGQGGVSESLLTGEASPVAKRPGRPLLAGSENFDGTLQMRVERIGAASTLQQVATLLDRAQLEKSPIVVLANRLARGFLAAVVAASVAVGLFWWWVDPVRAVPIVISVLIATCPCALSLATPTALAAATHGLAARGFLITRGHVLEALSRVTRVVFDKTGTLTSATPVLRAVHPVDTTLGAAELIDLAAQLEATSTHPMARALCAAAPDADRPGDRKIDEVAVETGAGVSGVWGGRTLRLGRPDWSGALYGARTAPVPPSSGGTRSFALLSDGRGAIAWFEFDSLLRPDAEAAVRRLDEEGYARALLSGDPCVAGVEAVARRLGFEEARAGADPEAKLHALDDWIDRGDIVAAVGDGINDAALLGRAQVSVAMGSGSELAHVRADAVLLDDRLASIPLALLWARKARTIMKQNFAWALAYNLCVLPLAASGLMAPYLAAIGMSSSSLLVVVNSMRLRRGPSSPLREGG
jgi:Cu2+-exporting ATPase